MKNTEYKDVFDFGEEALSTGNKFSAPSLPSFKNAFTLGENIRGMNNVSPLATVKFFNQTTETILNKYYPDGKNVQRGNINMITDVNISNGELSRFDENYYFDNNHNGKFGDSGDILAFKLVLFISADGLKIRECYEVTEPKDDEVILFLETDSGLSKQVLFGRMSEKVRRQFTDKNGNLKSNLYDNEILKGVRKHYTSANQEVIEKLIKNGYVKESVIKEGFFKVLKYLGIATTALPKVIGWVLEKLGSWIDYLKIDEQFWDTENENYFLKKENLIENFTISTETIKKIEELLNNKDDLSVIDLMSEAIEEGIQYILSKIKTTIEQYNEFIKEIIKELYDALDNYAADFIFQNLAEGFALLCGIWNGAVDFISGIFKFAAALLQAPSNIVDDFQTTLELIDNFWDIVTTKIFWVNLWESIKETYTKIKNELTNLDAANFNWVKIAYFTGFGLATIASFFIPVAQIANVAKAGKTGEIMTKFTSEISSGFVKGANIIGQKSAQAFENSIKIFREMLALFSQGKKKLTAFFENIWKKIVEWFRKNKAGMAENINTGIKMSAKEFEEGLKKLSKIKASEALEHLNEALIYFNHHIINGRVVQISNTNCINVVKSIEEFLATGKLSAAEPSKVQNIFELEKIFGKSFLTYSISSLNKIMLEGERGIIYGFRGPFIDGHVFNVIKKNGKLIFIDAQISSGKANLDAGYKLFKYLKTN